MGQPPRHLTPRPRARIHDTPYVRLTLYPSAVTRGRVKGQHGSVRRLPSGRWQARLPKGIDPDVRPVEPGVTYETRDEALDALAKTLRGIKDGTIVLDRDDAATAAGPYTVEKMIETFLTEHRDLAPDTRRQYRSACRSVLFKPGVGIGDVPVSRLTTPMLREWKLGLSDKGVKPSMETAAWKALSSALSWEVNMGRLAATPATLPKARGTKRRRAAAAQQHSHADDQPTWAEYAQILAAIPNRRDRLMTLVLGWGGLRLSEAAALKPSSITPAGLDVMTVWERNDQTGERQEAPVKTGERRIVPVPAGLAALLEREKRNWRPTEGRATALFLNDAAEKYPGTYDRFSWRDQVWNPMREATGLTTPAASLRGYAASVLVDAGATLLEVRDLLGHADTKTTEKHYARSQALRAADPDRMAVRLDGALTVQQRLDALWKAWERRFGKPMTLKAPQ